MGQPKSIQRHVIPAVKGGIKVRLLRTSNLTAEAASLSPNCQFAHCTIHTPHRSATRPPPLQELAKYGPSLHSPASPDTH